MKKNLRLALASLVVGLLASPFVPGAAANQPPVASPACHVLTQNAGKAVTLAGIDADGDPLTYSVKTLPLHGTLTGVPPNLTFTPAVNFTGGDSFTFAVSDGQAISVAATISLNVVPPGTVNLPPVTALTSPATGATFSATGGIALQATASDPDGVITQVSFYSDGVKIGASTTPPYQFTWTNPTPGTRVLTSKAFDDGVGAQKMFSFSAPVQVTVTGTVAPPATPGKYALNVVGGSGAGSYASGTVVTIVANAPAPGYVFSQWIGVSTASSITTTTTLTMPAANVTVTAAFQAAPVPPAMPPAAPVNPILFVTQIPVGNDFTTIGSVFGNHRPGTDSVGRGGDLCLRYPDGSVRKLTAEAGFGVATGFQGTNAIAVRDPAVHWSGQKALFSMVVGAPTSAFTSAPGRWQIYEVSGLGAGETAVITPVPHQPYYNNISPCYGTDGRVIFTSDRPRNGQPQLYPQLDEYELAPTVSGLWSLDPATGDLFNLNHAPSGAFTPTIDSFGRVIFTRWDHLQRDQEADFDSADVLAGRPLTYGTFNYSDESATAQVLAGNRTEVFPESRFTAGFVAGHTFNIFFPWMIQEDGTEEETVNHVGRHELFGYGSRSFLNDPNLVDFTFNPSNRFNPTYINAILQMKEDPLHPGRYFGTDAPEFSTHASGQIVALNAPPGLDADHITLDYITHPATKLGAPSPAPSHTGHYREPLPLSNGTLVASHTDVTEFETKKGVTGSDYAFRLKTLWQVGTYWQPCQTLTPGFSKSVSYYANGGLVTYSGPLWELNPVEVRARPIPAGAKTPLGQPEQQVFAEEGVSVPQFKDYLRVNGLALVVSRNVTTRDHAERQQPFNLRVAGTATQTLGAGGAIYDVSYLQFFQADQIRGFGLRNANSSPMAGRRVLAQPLHDPAAVANNPAVPSAPTGSVQLGNDGSMAAFLPARRATTWQLTDPLGTPTVRERYWLTFQPGEIRSCTSCHGINTRDQANHPAPTNKPEALRTLLQYWKAQTGN